jgi:hypothetical protein
VILRRWLAAPNVIDMVELGFFGLRCGILDCSREV